MGGWVREISKMCLRNIGMIPYSRVRNIYVRQGINVGPGKFDKNNKHRALNKRRAWKMWQKYVMNIAP